MMKLLRSAAAALVGVSVAATAQAPAPVSDTLAKQALQWREMIPGVSFASAYGDWEKGAHAKYVRIDRTAQVPMHTHSGGYHAVMISGRMANLHEGGQRVELSPGDYFRMDARRPHAHVCLTDEPCFFYTYSDAAWDIEVPELD